jgi:hypothetical protein
MVRLSDAMAVAPPHLTPTLSAPWRGGEGARLCYGIHPFVRIGCVAGPASPLRP